MTINFNIFNAIMLNKILYNFDGCLIIMVEIYKFI